VLATGGDDGTVRLWDPSTGSPLGSAPLTGHTGPVRWGAWARIDFDENHGPITVSLMSESGAPSTVDISGPTIKRQHPVLATGGDDDTVWLQDPSAGSPLGSAPLSGHTDPVWWGAWARIDYQSGVISRGAAVQVRYESPEEEASDNPVWVFDLVDAVDSNTA